MKIEIPVALLKAVSLASARNDIRFYLNGVHVSAFGRYAAIVATDGKRIHQGSFGVPGFDAKVELTIPFDAVRRALVGVGVKPLVLEQRPDGLTLNGVQFDPVGGTYPNWKEAMRTGSGDPRPLQFRAAHVSDLAKAAVILGGKYAVLEFGGGDKAWATVRGVDNFSAVCLNVEESRK